MKPPNPPSKPLPDSLPDWLLNILADHGVPPELIASLLRRCQPERLSIPARLQKSKNRAKSIDDPSIEQGQAQMVSFWADAALIRSIQIDIAKSASKFPTLSDFGRWALVLAHEVQQSWAGAVGEGDLDVLQAIEESTRQAELQDRARAALNRSLDAIRRNLDLGTAAGRQMALRFAEDCLEQANGFKSEALAESWRKAIQERFGRDLKEAEAEKRRRGMNVVRMMGEKEGEGK